MSHSPTIKTVKPAGGGDFTNLQDWADYASAQTSAHQWAKCYTGGDLGNVTLSGWTATPTNESFPKIYAAPGENSTNISNGAYISNTTGDGIKNHLPYLEVQGLRVFGSGMGNGMRMIWSGAGCGMKVSECVVVLGGTGFTQYGVVTFDSSSTYGVKLHNTLIVNTATPSENWSALGTHFITNGSQFEILNTTIISTGKVWTILLDEVDAIYNIAIKNSCFITEGDFDSIDIAVSAGGEIVFDADYNATNDGLTSLTGGSNNQDSIIPEDTFVDYEGGDYTPLRTSTLYKAGTDVRLATSLNGKNRGNHPDIGAYQVACVASTAEGEYTGTQSIGRATVSVCGKSFIHRSFEAKSSALSVPTDKYFDRFFHSGGSQ